MSRRSIAEIRKTELSQAAFEVLIEAGIRGTTLERVAERAGVSKGVVLHHFKDKDALFSAVMRRASALLGDGVVELLRHAQSPIERLCAVLVGNFAAPIFNREICNAWISLCADVPYNTQNQRIQTVIQSRMRSNLVVALRAMVPLEDAELYAFQIATTIDGVWLRASMQERTMSSRDGIDHMKFAVNRILGAAVLRDQNFEEASNKFEALAEIILNTNAFAEKALGKRRVN